MSSCDLHCSPQTTLWKRLRLIRRCIYCRNKKQISTIQNKYLQCKSQNSTDYQLVSSLAVINLQIMKCSKQKQKDTNEELSGIKKINSIELVYHQLSQSCQKMKVLTYYYRYYDQRPLTISPQVFRLINNYKTKRKMIEYEKIKILFSGQKSTNQSSKNKKGSKTNKAFLNLIQQTHHDLTASSFLAVRNQGFTSRKTVEQIDSQYCFSQKQKKNYSSKKKMNAIRLQYKVNTDDRNKSKMHKSKKQHKSCDNIRTTDNKIMSKTQIGIRKLQSFKSQQDTRKKFQLYIGELKNKIQKQKGLLRCQDTKQNTAPKKMKKKQSNNRKSSVKKQRKQNRQSSEFKTKKSMKKISIKHKHCVESKYLYQNRQF